MSRAQNAKKSRYTEVQRDVCDDYQAMEPTARAGLAQDGSSV